VTNLGAASLRRGQVQEALRLFQQALALEPQAAAYHVNLATAFAQAGEQDAAIRHLNSAIEIDPSLEVAYRRLVEIYARDHRDREVRAVFERYLKFRPQSLTAREAVRSPSAY